MTGHQLRRMAAAIVTLGLVATAPLSAHEVTHRGTVLEVQPDRLHVQTVDADGEDAEAIWFTVVAATIVLRGDERVPYADAEIMQGEQADVIINDDFAPEEAVEILLAEK